EVRADYLRNAAELLSEIWDRLGGDVGPRHEARVGEGQNGEVPSHGSAIPDAVEAGRAAVAATAAAALPLAGECRNSDDRLLISLRRIADLTAELDAAGDDWPEVLRLLVHAPAISHKNTGNQGNWRDIAEARRLVGAVAASVDEATAAIGAVVAEAVLARLSRYAVDSARERAAAGRLRFHDLLVLCRDLLGTEEVRSALRRRWTHVLVDEFQDTDPIQLEIARRLAGGPDGSPDPGRLFFVGDPKQSIYRFRHADISMYAAARDQLVATRLNLTTNFRSVPGILHWVNSVFGLLMQPRLDGTGGVQAEFTHLAPVRRPNEGRPPVLVTGGGVTDKIDDIRVREAASVAGLIERVIGESWPVGDRDGGPERGATLADIAVLVPRRIALGPIENELDAAGIAYRVMSSSLVYGTEEVRDLISIARAIDSPADDVAVVAALRSPAFGCGDDDLVRHRHAGGRWDYTVQSGTEGSPVAVAMDALRGYHESRNRLGISGTLDAVVRDRCLLQ
ncbi:MAG TPA: UvrD-helicase domain-containing protein, partial [Acidimicrobiales bacterium]|nr:UvrD-helicase domain-containing protein [Acidimicrobiales bacterium]